MSGRNKGPDKDMQQPKAYKSSIDPMNTKSSVSMDTRQTHYKSAKPIDFNNKIPEYKTQNYKTSFWEAPKRKMIQQKALAKKKETSKPKPAPPPPKAPQQPKPPPKYNNGLQALPQPNFNSKPRKASVPFQPKPDPPQSQPPPYPVRHFEDPEPEMWSSSPSPNIAMETWGEPVMVVPDLNPKPTPVKKEQDFSMLPSTVGSMSRMIGMFR